MALAWIITAPPSLAQAAVGAAATSSEDEVEPLPEVAAPPESVPAPAGEPAHRGDPPPISNPDAGPVFNIDLPTALRLADRANPEIGIARQAISENLARLQGARVLLLPSLTTGMNYHDHNGNLQQNNGSMLQTSQQAFYYGGGAGNVFGSNTVANPMVRIYSHLGNALFEPLAARQFVSASRFEAGARFNSVLLEVSVRYLDLMAAEAQLEVLVHSQRDAADFARITQRFADTGQGRRADAERAKAEARLIDSQTQSAMAQVAVSAAELARVLTLDPSLRLRTIGGPIPALTLVDQRFPLDRLLQVAMSRRPELAARNAEVAAAQTRYRQEKTRALFPTVSIGFSSGMFGGGSNTTVPTFGDFGARTDFDAVAYWTVQNSGLGNQSRWEGRRAETGQAAAARVRALNAVRREVSEAYAQSEAARQQIEISRLRLSEAELGYQEEFARIRGGEGLPIELLNNLTRAISARQAMVTAIATYDQAQFRLFVALGQPPTLAGPNLVPLSGPPRRTPSP